MESAAYYNHILLAPLYQNITQKSIHLLNHLVNVIGHFYVCPKWSNRAADTVM